MRGPEQAGATPAVRVVDRTFLCTLDRSYMTAGMRALDLDAAPARRLPFAPPVVAPAWVGVGTGTAGPTSPLIVVRTRQYPQGNWQPPNGPAGPGVYVNSRRCSSTSARPALSRTGLPGPVVRWETFADCETPRRALVRVRAILAAPTRWAGVNATYEGAVRNVASATFSVRAERTGAQIGFVQLRGTAMSMWYGGRCR